MKTARMILEIRNSDTHGKGVFATTHLPIGSVVCTLEGEELSHTKMVDRIVHGKEDINDPFQIGKRTYLDLDEISRSFNHRCDPNTGIRKRSEMFAIKDIKPGDEITFDYSTTIAPTDWRMECRCGAEKCRKVISDVRSIPKKQLKRYLELGALQRYMKPIVKLLEEKKYVIPEYEKLALKRISKM